VGRSLCEKTGIDLSGAVSAVEVEFREVPYFIVARARDKWSPEQGDVNAFQIIGVTDTGLLADPKSLSKTDALSNKQTFIPWTNILSLSVEVTA
jgi:hypothetical protein